MHKLNNIQIIRAIAAVLVVFGHLEGFAKAKMNYIRTDIPTGSGVDLFFIVSGFVMVLTSVKFRGISSPGVKNFLFLRLIRIVPLYWACTLLYIALNFVSAHSDFSLLHIAASFLFIPFDGLNAKNGNYFPVLDLGWTLNYEMYFYLLFGVSLMVGKFKPIFIAGALLTASVAIGFFVPKDAVQLYFWTRPIIIEFAIGMVIAELFMAGFRFPLGVCISGGIIAVLLLTSNLAASFISALDGTTLNDSGRVIAWGLPMGVLFASIALMRVEKESTRSFKPLSAIGDASYSLYLLHPFVIIVLWQVWERLHILQQYPIGFIFNGLLFSIVVALLIFKYFETTVSKYLKRLTVYAL